MAVSRRRFFAKAGAIGATLALGRNAVAQPPVADNTELTAVEFVTGPTQKAINKALGYLARRQNDDGSLGSGNYGRNVAVCSLSGMAFMTAAGVTSQRRRTPTYR